MYVSFLCIQARYNLAIAGITHRLLIQNSTGSLEEISKSESQEKKNTEVLANVKQRPCKRFYQKTIPFVPVSFEYTEVFFAVESFAEYNITASPLLTLSDPPQRGPPSVS